MSTSNYSRPPLRLSDHGPLIYRFPNSCERSTSGWHDDEPLPIPDPKMIHPPLPPSSDWTDELREACVAYSRLNDSGMSKRNAPIVLFWIPQGAAARRQADVPTGGRHAVSLDSTGRVVRHPSYVAELEKQVGRRSRTSLYILAQVEAHVKPWSAGPLAQAYFKVFADYFWKPEDGLQHCERGGFEDERTRQGLCVRHVQQSLSAYPWYQGMVTDAEACVVLEALLEIARRIRTYIDEFLQQPISQRGPVPVIMIGEVTPRPGITI
ncbi:hypothetical protein BC834DRAFT_904254 [Gloeopeniophorella convolvens]|nr:hypothetical protein BC834DRAFT_904254 [Gloeopeniophorella convolvens]